MVEKKAEASIKIYDDRKAFHNFTIAITLPSELWKSRKRIVDLIAKILKGEF